MKKKKRKYYGSNIVVSGEKEKESEAYTYKRVTYPFYKSRSC